MTDALTAYTVQPSLFGNEDLSRQANPEPTIPDPESIRRRLRDLLGTARSAEVMPWSDRDARMWRTVFPQMANWLPQEEAEVMRCAFRSEMDRLDGGISLAKPNLTPG